MKVKGNVVAAIALGVAMAVRRESRRDHPGSGRRRRAHTVSREVGKPLKAAQEDLKKGDYKGALQKLQEADALPKKSPYEQHLIHEMEGYAYVRTQQYPQAAKALEPGLTDGFLDARADPAAHGRARAAQLPDQELRQGDPVRHRRRSTRARPTRRCRRWSGRPTT